MYVYIYTSSVKKKKIKKFTSTGGMFAVAFVVVVIIYFAVQSESASGICGDDDDTVAGDQKDEPHCGSTIEPFKFNISLLKMLSITTFAYTAHVQALSVANEVTVYSQPKMDMIIGTGIFLCGIVYVAVGLLGYIAFGDDVEGNVILAYPPTILVDLARIAMCGLVAISYPLMCKPGRDSFISLLKNSRYKESAETNTTYYSFTIGFLGLSYIIALSVVNNPMALDLILSLIGATCSTVIAYIIPTLVYCILHPEPCLKKYLAIAVGIFGVISMPFCIYATFM
jgi:amino acid permease